MADPAPEVTIADPGSWRGRTAELAERLRALSTQSGSQAIGSPAVPAADPSEAVILSDPMYWAERPFELDEVLTLAALPAATVEAASPDLVAGAASATEGRLTMTVEEAAAALGISRALAYEAARRSEIPVVRIGRRMLVPRAALTRLLDQAEPPKDQS